MTEEVKHPESDVQAAQTPSMAPEAQVGQESAISRILRRREEEFIDVKTLTLREVVVNLNRVAKVVKGGRRFSFNAMVVVGDEDGHVGVGFGKANEVPESIAKAVDSAKKNIVRVPLVGRTIMHETLGEYGAAKVLLKPAAEGTGIIAGPAVRAVVELAGVRDILTKSLGSNNVINVVKATIEGLRKMMSPEDIQKKRSKSLQEIMGKKFSRRYLEQTGKTVASPVVAEPQASVVAKEETAEAPETSAPQPEE